MKLLQYLTSIIRTSSFVRMSSTASPPGSKLAPWEKPQGTPVDTLKLYNSLTRSKEDFVPLIGRRVLWYSCGPTVYDASHMGHARSYITFDILRRVLSDYFKYDIFYVMNITDVDDKIIRRARQKHLLEQYDKQGAVARADLTEALEAYRTKLGRETDSDKKALMTKTLETAVKCLDHEDEGLREAMVKQASDPLASWLDSKYGASVTEHGIFSLLTQHWEEEFHSDMEALNVLPADVLTRVSEYVPEVVTYVQRIIDKGHAYVSKGSVYFDVSAFSADPAHHYAKLVPEAVGNNSLIAEGEGELSSGGDKKCASDFALWKASKSGEPSWESPWGSGRPGWHIECSVMACAILGGVADIHTGGVDLKFPHHDNEIAQAEAAYGHDQWMSYFLHSGHLTIDGCKMSKSLKNFITIKEALSQHSARQLRLAFLLHSWGATLDYSPATMREALYWEKLFNEFFLSVKDRVRRAPVGVASYSKFTDADSALSERFLESKSSVHSALCDSIDTLSVMKVLKKLVTAANVYSSDSPQPNVRLLVAIATYITDILKVFGVIPTDTTIGFPVDSQSDGTAQVDAVEPFVSLLADFRDSVRRSALLSKNSELLKLCDCLRDEQLPNLGVVLDDKTGHSVVKMVGREAAIRDRQQAKQVAAEREKAKAEQRAKLEAAKAEREAAAAVPPGEMFRRQTDKYGQFDEGGIPTHDLAGQALTDNQRKKLKKLQSQQEKKHAEYLARQ